MRRRLTALGLRSIAILCVIIGGCALIPAGDGNGNTNTNTNDNSDNTNDNSAGAKLVVFADPDSDFTTTDVRDVQDEIVQFDEDTLAIIWKATGASFQGGGWAANGNFLGAAGSFQVRFGTVNGERRAYFTETVPATICDIQVSGATLSIFPTSVTVPQE